MIEIQGKFQGIIRNSSLSLRVCDTGNVYVMPHLKAWLVKEINVLMIVMEEDYVSL